MLIRHLAMKRGEPSIVAPLSRRVGRKSFPYGVCIILSTILAFVLTICFVVLMMANDSRPATAASRPASTLLRKPTVINEKRGDESRRESYGAGADTVGAHRNKAKDVTDAKGLILHTYLGPITIHFTPERSGRPSIDYIIKAVTHASSRRNSAGYDSGLSDGRGLAKGHLCSRCKFYRAEPKLLLQGVIGEKSVAANTVLGPCSEENYVQKEDCPEHDPNCGCHGPIMTRGMVGWAGGGGGPDFFIVTKPRVDWYVLLLSLNLLFSFQYDLSYPFSQVGASAHSLG